MSKKWNDELVTEVKQLAETGATIRKIAEQLDISDSVAYDIVRGLDIEKPWKIRRRLRQQQRAEESLKQEKERNMPSQRDLEIVDLYKAGKTLEEIAKGVGLTRERVRQIINKSGESTKEIRVTRRNEAEATRQQLKLRTEEWINSHKGCTPVELEHEVGCSWTELQSIISNRFKQLVLFEMADEDDEPHGAMKWSREQILFAIRQAGKRRSPLTSKAYSELQEAGVVMGPTSGRIIHRFGSWSVACAIAGVESGEALRDNYTTNWTNHDLIKTVMQFMSESESFTVDAYDRWENQQTGLPSSVTIRVKFGSWPAVQRRALEKLRESWAV